MRRLRLAPVIAAIALAASGCASAQHTTAARQTPRLRGMHLPPKWLTTLVGREDERFHARLNHGYPGNGLSVRPVNGAIVVGLWGKFTSPTVPATHGNFLRLVITPNTHRVERVRLMRQINPFAVARRSAEYLHIFPSMVGKAPCRIPRGGPAPGSVLAGQCETEYAPATHESAAAHAIRILLGESWQQDGRTSQAAWIVTVRWRDGKVLGTRIEGQPPQLWR